MAAPPDLDFARTLLEGCDPDVVRLATAVSLAVRVEPGLLRSARIELTRPRVGVGAEADLWFGPLVASYTGRGLVLDTGVAALLREELARDPQRLTAARMLTHEVHLEAAPTIRLEEDLLYAALTGADREVGELLERALVTMHGDADRRRGVARWAARAVATLPPDARANDAALELVAGAERVLQAPVEVGVRLLHSGVEFSQPPRPGAAILELPPGGLQIQVRRVDGNDRDEIVSIVLDTVVRYGLRAGARSGVTAVDLRTADGRAAVLARRDPPQPVSDRPQFLSTMFTRFWPIWRLIQRTPTLERTVNRWLINKTITVVPVSQLSAKQDFMTQDALADRSYNARLIAPASAPESGPEPAAVAELFRRDEFIPSEKSTVLFAYLAAWFAEGLMRSSRSPDGVADITRSASTHEIDLSQLYGANPKETNALRDPEQPMLLASQVADGEELPPDLFGPEGAAHREFAALRSADPRSEWVDNAQLLAMGSNAANAHIGFALFNTLFLREHNRVARALAADNPAWDEDRIFAATRSVLTVVFIKILLEEFVNHIHPFHFQFRLDPRGFDGQRWMRPNWNTVEANLLYRWHSLMPSQVELGPELLPLQDAGYRTKELLSAHGLAAIVDSASRQPAGRVGLHNTAEFLLTTTELPSIAAGRQARLRGYNDYRVACQFRPARTFEEITRDPQVIAELRNLYGSVDDVELYVGAFAEDIRPNSVLPPLLGRFFGFSALRQLLANPLFGPGVYHEETFSRRGIQIIAETTSLRDIVARNVPAPSHSPLVTLTRQDWIRV